MFFGIVSHPPYVLGLLATLAALCVPFALAIFCLPEELRKKPRVPVIPTFLSFLAGETEDVRTRRLILRTAQQHDSGLVIMWALGSWYVHVVDSELGKRLMEHKTVRKQPARAEMLFWRLTGAQNVIFSDGDTWARHAESVRSVLHNHLPMDIFAALSRKLIRIIGDGGRIRWSDYTHRFTLDVVGLAIMGYDFDTLEDPNGTLVQQYTSVMTDISHPLYVGFPILEKIFPRRRLRERVDSLREVFRRLLESKKHTPGTDYVSIMLNTGSMSDDEYLDNTVTMFMAGHDTTAGSLSSVFYYLAKYPDIQDRARSEVLAAIAVDSDPTTASFRETPFLNACIREALRLNGPSVMTLPRVSDQPLVLDSWVIPPGTPVILNLYGVLHNPRHWTSPDEYLPDRWLTREKSAGEVGAWMPFGSGPRRCPAMNFSLYEQRTLLALFLREFRWTLPANSMHRTTLRNALSTFALNLPEELDLEFKRIA
ncbi:cytochrome P450 [Vararia minispora EC-137]|uniref:Cytochrome P450 n=1 Tax=Vararia minispora EC-137 TaxID=1314806 RepID=A0ACB8QDJ0_9AGAM|nr:cytochrome P450 [Vararia minispora EC-137]